MDQAALQSIWRLGGQQAMTLLGQTVRWKGEPHQAIVDGLSYSTELRARGGGLVEQFSGSIVFLKSTFAGPTGPVYPQIGDRILVPRTVSIKAIDGLLDLTDPFLTCLYEPVMKK